ncbi:hypothetical protein GA0061096_0727 [Fictibacillus enclensis]|uniref:Uncharacterized protein n=1 Tax=Fictibacillus enclensis TaxID=1017270 RepID=A0A0V8JCF5_9BACL|nr:hypothetical protein [Fictibacillus enclensis]KSU84609.1 hypothetical protein AS030_03450 [Fictibacillus enclensis]SCB82328.1 hypothetical protein GA0061096_0727 [Fictibacillus enclensis]
MKKPFIHTLVPLLAALLILSPIQAHAKAPERAQQECLSPKHVKLHGDLRKLWIDHTIWTRSYIVSALAGLKDQDLVPLLKESSNSFPINFKSEKEGTPCTFLFPLKPAEGFTLGQGDPHFFM